MKILQFSDWHAYYTPLVSILRLMETLSAEQPDVIICCGDYTGTKKAEICVATIVKLIRDVFPNTPFGTVLGNHDYWLIEKKKIPTNQTKQLNNIIKIFQQNNIHFFDKDGVMDVAGVQFVGHSGWYCNPKPPTNDAGWMSQFQVNTHSLMSSTANDETGKNIELLQPNKKTIYVSHFSVNDDGVNDWKGGFATFGGNPNIGKILQENYNCTMFLHGHSHMLKRGPLNYECGSDYDKPSYKIWEA